MGENYVTQINEKVIDLAENNDFPLFTMPWNVPLLDFLRNWDTPYHIWMTEKI